MWWLRCIICAFPLTPRSLAQPRSSGMACSRRSLIRLGEAQLAHRRACLGSHPAHLESRAKGQAHHDQQGDAQA